MMSTSTSRARPQVIIAGAELAHQAKEIEALADLADTTILSPQASHVELCQAVRKADVLVVDTTPINREVIQAASKLRAIVQYGVGVDHIDIEAATEHGIYVIITPEAVCTEVAEHAVGLLFAQARRIVQASRDVLQGGLWETYGARYVPRRLFGSILALIGFGRIGREVYRITSGIGFKVIVYDPSLAPEQVATATNGQALWGGELLSVLAQADFVLIQVPLIPTTRHLIGREALAAMKPTAYLISVSRGDVIDEEALVEALEQGRIAGVALDILSQAPHPPNHPLLTREDVVITPHIAWKSQVAEYNVEMQAVSEVRRVLQGQQPRYLLNREVVARPTQLR
jgi:D-3-phosphoglycerate dehydrogenase / 2-oxoglutarate reductase